MVCNLHVYVVAEPFRISRPLCCAFTGKISDTTDFFEKLIAGLPSELKEIKLFPFSPKDNARKSSISDFQLVDQTGSQHRPILIWLDPSVDAVTILHRYQKVP